jgi:O-methyltransferase
MISQSKRIIKRSLRRAGYELRKLSSPEKGGTPYGDVRPFATYSPWLTDIDFRRVYDEIKDHTLVDVYRCYDLWQLVGESAKTARGEFLEVGVWRGGTGGLIASRCRQLNLNAQVFLCDTFRGVVKAGREDSAYSGGEHADTSAQLVAGLLERLGLANVTVLKGIFPDQTGHAVEDLNFRFCHVDVDVYQSAKDVFNWVWLRLVIGGIVVFDDYGFSSCPGIVRLVEEQRSLPDRVTIHNLNGHAVIVKVA